MITLGGYARNQLTSPQPTRWKLNLMAKTLLLHVGKQIFCEPEKDFRLDLEKAVISLKHRRFKHTVHILVDRAWLRNLLTTSSTHVKVTASFRLVGASCSLAMKFSLVCWFL